ncbi:MAG TPA: hypothetical protein DER01_19105 [Phycisphaerales bacterium]|nr:hypothetical protein [Phycisphaerales bacterium]
MAQTLRLKRFTNVAILKRINTQLLMQFLNPYRDFLTGQRGMSWPANPDHFDHTSLAKILMSPSIDTPESLLDALFFVDGLADADCYDRILEEIQEFGVDLGVEDPTPEDLTLRVWLIDPNILERVHAEQNRVRPKTFQSFFTTEVNRPSLMFPETDTVIALENDLNKWFEFKKKGRGARVFPFPREDGFWFLVRHGQRIKREGTVEVDGDSGSVFYRPEKFDVLIYYPQTGELAIYADTKGEREIYCQLFGRHLFADDDFFCFGNIIEKYSLLPLIENARASLTCADVAGITGIVLYELHIQHSSNQRDIEIRRADDVFVALKHQQRELQDEQSSTRLIKAKFKVTFVGGRERCVTITPPNTATFDRETDNSMIHDWLTKRGFVKVTGEGVHADEAVLAMA